MTTTALWWAVVASGLYHGVNPGMGWPLAVSAAMFENKRTALVQAIAMLGIGHFLATALVLAPFALLTALVEWERPIRIVSGIFVFALGSWVMITRRHPRFLARVAPQRLIFWSFLVALAHGAALMLVPIYLGLCTVDAGDTGHQAASTLISGGAGEALAVASVHTLAMVIGGGLCAGLVYLWFGLKVLSKAWLNLETVWAGSLMAVGALAAAEAALQ
ncbi:hypothetical protein [Aurantimonas sp. VKM B-3413]|uniref:hypothetical protein n=1 Tax=Aurantimonas sp. VKM B-3413 TaxID=2779401 RepID=UPI001E569D8E|nr:hypothetical protein [Aurantimonas sp. VKM B-3413]MCB8839956.1 hypothetical protein [Aurantimonas sp. VKM B-3413]